MSLTIDNAGRLLSENLPSHINVMIERIRKSLDQSFFLGVTGSAMYSIGRTFNDVDLICIIPDASDIQATGPALLECGFDISGWADFVRLFQRGKVHIFGCWHAECSEIRIEVLTAEVMRRVCRCEDFIVKRLRRGPLQPKICTLRSTDGSEHLVEIKPEDLGAARYSEVPNVLISQRGLFVGMHLERILLAYLFQPQEAVTVAQAYGWETLRNLIFDIPAAGDVTVHLRNVEDIFFAATEFCDQYRTRVRTLLGG